PSCIQIELTESTVMQNPSEVVAIIKDLQHMGVDVAIDDFGTGYSSLAQLRQFPVNVMKIDRAFVQNMTDDIHDEAIARTIVQLGQSLSMNLVAEGIETEEQADMLGSMDCHHGQGFWFAKPMNQEDLKTWLIDHYKNINK
ncbi:MAG TPA: EAL domain-containing protein, partial [Thiotrichales bacterium]|nr:EAL domain-containing protein [Thiotrichales bacterium]